MNAGKAPPALTAPVRTPPIPKAGVGLLRRSDVQCAESVHDPCLELAGSQQAVAADPVLTQQEANITSPVAATRARGRLVAQAAHDRTTAASPAGRREAAARGGFKVARVCGPWFAEAGARTQ
jgi:hypothetical protein